MSEPKNVESLSLLPDRLSVAEFNPYEIEQLLGGTAEDQMINKSNFNWLGAYLVEEVGLLESELVEWFRGDYRGLGFRRPLEVWNDYDGYLELFNYAQLFKEQVDENLADEPVTWRHKLNQSHEIARSALDVIIKGFADAGVELLPTLPVDMYRGKAITNPDKQDAPVANWRGNDRMEEYKIRMPRGAGHLTYFIIRYMTDDEKPQILQSGVFGDFNGERIEGLNDSDLDGRAPSAGEVAEFVIPLANEVKNRSLALIE